MSHGTRSTRRTLAAALTILALSASGLVGCTPSSEQPPDSASSRPATSGAAPLTHAPETGFNPTTEPPQDDPVLRRLKVPGASTAKAGKVVVDTQFRGPSTLAFNLTKGHGASAYLACSPSVDSVKASLRESESTYAPEPSSRQACSPRFTRLLAAVKRSSGKQVELSLDLPQGVNARLVVRESVEKVAPEPPYSERTILKRRAERGSTLTIKTDPSKYLVLLGTNPGGKGRFTVHVSDPGNPRRIITMLEFSGSTGGGTASHAPSPTGARQVTIRVTGGPVQLEVREASGRGRG